MSCKSTILSAAYFPFTFISPSLVEAMSLCFHHIVVYRPAHAKSQDALLPWMEKGFMDVRSPFEKRINKELLDTALPNFKRWGLLHQYADMSYLKAVGNDIAPVGPETPRIASDIRTMAAKSSRTFEESGLPVQLFLHLAQEFDQHSWELRQQLNRLNDQYQALQSSFRQDQAEEARYLIQEETLPHIQEDPGSFMIEKRMAAWNHLFQNDPADSGLLFTDSRLAFAYLLDEVQEKVEILKLNITYTKTELKEALKNRPPWTDHLQEIFDTVLTTPWSRTFQEEFVQSGREIEARIDHWRESTMKSHDRSISLRWYVVPGQVARNLLNRRCGVESGADEDKAAGIKNTLVGIIEEGRPAVS